MNLIYLVYYVLVIYSWVIVARGLLTWMTLRPGTAMYRVQGVLFALTEPYLSIFRRLLPPRRVGAVAFDWSYLIGLVVLIVALQVVGRL